MVQMPSIYANFVHYVVQHRIYCTNILIKQRGRCGERERERERRVNVNHIWLLQLLKMKVKREKLFK